MLLTVSRRGSQAVLPQNQNQDQKPPQFLLFLLVQDLWSGRLSAVGRHGHREDSSDTGENLRYGDTSPSPLICHHGYSFSSPQSSSVSLHCSVADDEEEGDDQAVKFVTSEAEEEVEAGPSSDITALLLRYRHGYRRAIMLLCVCGAVIFTIGTHTQRSYFIGWIVHVIKVGVVCLCLSFPVGLRHLQWAVPLFPGGGAGGRATAGRS